MLLTNESIPKKYFMILFIQIALIKSPYLAPSLNNGSHDQNGWRKKKVIHWNCNDVVDWLYSLQIREFFR